ncbi:cation:proton antiporter [Dokdonella sp.]|uniref:cation:proton antiporter n=1 Tax=Dokdonella sp. TaxID=2291710 RepID=UPI001B217930|nr:cation:proton antiporter [Dokdonella sp.]MBO9661834.1 cation:proton antiporter [Dokdonella sp.]
MNATSHLLLQLALILGLARLLAWLLGRLGQPPVIGEMIAGFLLGPIAFGALAPELHRWLFAPEHLVALNGISQIGLVLFMFVIGAELRAPHGARAGLLAAAWIGVLAVVVPVALGLGLAPLLHAHYAPDGVGFWPFALFLAVSLGITAFPVLARILKDRDLTRGAVGQLALAAAAIADALAWILLALVVALVGAQGWQGFARALVGLAAIAALGFVLLRPLIARWLARHADDGRPTGGVLGVLLAGACAMAAATEWLGLHAVFGAFLFGLCLPRDDRLLEILIERIEHVAVLALMPVFFALAGLNTSADAFAAAALPMLGLVLAVAIAGKLLGAGAGARIAGLPWRSALTLGALMNTRGLMELIVLKVGLDAGVIGHELFTMLTVMAIVTTLMTSPIVGWLTRGRHAAPQGLARESQ